MKKIQIGSATLYNGNCMKILPTLETGSMDAVITDPPYSSGGSLHPHGSANITKKYFNAKTKKKYHEFTGDNRDQRSYALWCSLWMEQCANLMKHHSVGAIFTDWRQLPNMVDIMQAGGLFYRGIVPWNKQGSCRKQKGRFAHQCEYVIWGSFGPMPFDRGVGCLPGFYEYRVDPREKLHITGKPVELMHDIIKITPDDAVILDPFMGSASTGVAALEQGKKFIGIELSEDYFNIACERLSKI
ncbi:MAG: site-specific DNA-methyltransferase [Flavobacteriales bacterium]